MATPPDERSADVERIGRARSAAVAALVTAGVGAAADARAAKTSGDGRVVRAGTAVLLAFPAEGVLVRVDDRVGPARAARHLAVGHALARLDVPAVRPLAGVDTPIDVDGSAVTLWELERLVRGSVGPGVVGHLAGRLHRATRDGNGCAGIEPFDPLRDVADQLAIATLSDDEAEVLAPHVDDIARRWSELIGGEPIGGDVVGGNEAAHVGSVGIVHGDLHAGNVLLTRRGPLLADLELAGVGPVAYDLAAPVVAVLRYGASSATLGAYARAYRAPIPDAVRHGVLRDAYELWLTSWALANRHLDGIHALEARRRLDRWRGAGRARTWSLR